MLGQDSITHLSTPCTTIVFYCVKDSLKLPINFFILLYEKFQLFSWFACFSNPIICWVFFEHLKTPSLLTLDSCCLKPRIILAPEYWNEVQFHHHSATDSTTYATCGIRVENFYFQRVVFVLLQREQKLNPLGCETQKNRYATQKFVCVIPKGRLFDRY